VRGLRKTRHSSALQRVRPQPLITTCGLELTADLIYTFSHSSFGPPFHHAATCPTSTAAFKCNDQFSAALKRPKSRVLHGIWRAPPENWSGGGAKRVEERGERKLTMSAFSFPQFTQIHPNIFFTLIMKPLWRSAAVTTSQSEHRAHQDDTQVLQVQHDRSDPGIQTCPHRRSGT
jgi:hypothetical protein